MVQLPAGDIEETRRGGPDVLQVMVRDAVAAGADSYIRVERRPKSGLPRTGHLVFRAGEPVVAIHEGELDRLGIPALMELEEDAMSIDALLTMHVGIEARPIVELHPDAILHLEMDESSDPNSTAQGEWWNEERIETLTWSRTTSLPDLIPNMQAPEYIKRMSEARTRRFSDDSRRVLQGGHLHLIDCNSVDLVLQLAGELNSRGRPLISISRRRVEKQLEFYPKEGNTCFWLVERPEDPEHIGPSLEGLLRLIEGWLDEHRSAVIVFDGLEFLSGTHGDDRSMGFLRRLADLVRDSDDILLLPVILSSWEERAQHQLIRATDVLPVEAIQEWLEDADSLEDHPFLELVMDEAEATAVDAELNRRMGVEEMNDQEQNQPVQPTQVHHEQEGGGESLDELMRSWARDSSEDQEKKGDESDEEWAPTFHSGATGEMISADEVPEEVHEPEANKEEETIGPRPAARLKRKARHTAVVPEISTQDSLEAAERCELDIGDLPELDGRILDELADLSDASHNAKDVFQELEEGRRVNAESQDALARGSEVASSRLEASRIPDLAESHNLEMHIDEWSNAIHQDRARQNADWPESTNLDQKVSKQWKAATDAALDPIHLREDMELGVASPMAARPGSKRMNQMSSKKKVASRKQRASDPTTVERRVREAEMKAYREYRIEGQMTERDATEQEGDDV